MLSDLKVLIRTKTILQKRALLISWQHIHTFVFLQDLPLSEAVIEEPWSNLFRVFEMVGRKLNWELCDVFKMPVYV